ncbi:hypothetical protein ETB55_21815 [Salmonella enterica subsp. enterica serovar Omuna]|nr:hypothetical protein [Salmonella enterica subsp. enterica serovar Omuna]
MAESQFYAILTDKGAALEATALATGTPVTLDKFVIGDGGGNTVTPDPTRTTLVNEVYRGNIKSAEAEDNQVTFTLYVPPEAGGYTIREAGILTADGTLYSLSNSPDILKPTESNGAVISVTFRYTLAVSSTSTVNVIVFDNYLTPDAADGKYLQINKNLSEIAAGGDAAKSAARDNIGIDGDIAFRDKNNTFAKPNTFSGEVTVENTLNIGKLGTTAAWGINFARSSTYVLPYKNSAVPTMVGLEIKQMLNQGKAKWRIWCTDARSLALVMDGVENYPVLSVNNNKPDTNGNVTVSTGSTVDLSNYYTKSEVDAMINSGDYASATPGAVKSYGLFTTYMTVSEGNTATGASIYYAGISGSETGGIDITKGSQPAGIWKILGKTDNVNGAFLAVRIS